MESQPKPEAGLTTSCAVPILPITPSSITDSTSSAHILFEHTSHDFALIDIPASIADAQNISISLPSSIHSYPAHLARRFEKRLISSVPLSVPFEQPDANSRKRTKNGDNSQSYNALRVGDERLYPLIQSALTGISSYVRAGDDRSWCLPRVVGEPSPSSIPSRSTSSPSSALHPSLGEKRKHASPEAPDSSSQPIQHLLSALFERLSSCLPVTLTLAQKRLLPASFTGVTTTTSQSDQSPSPWTHFISNNSLHTSEVVITPSQELTPSSPSSFMVYLPPRSHAILMSLSCLNASQQLHDVLSAINSQIHSKQGPNINCPPPAVPTRPHFPVVLMDPPWPNRSARRARAYAAQAGAAHSHNQLTPCCLVDMPDSLFDLVRMINDLELALFTSPHSWVGVWVTNSEAVRDAVLGRRRFKGSSIFESMGLDLVEEWVWLKTTKHGECISDLYSQWRKPYEVLLWGRPRSSSSSNRSDTVRQRVIVSVPDLHSRKPCVKGLIERWLINDQGHQSSSHPYGGLELFARYATADWCSIGNEVLKFNDATQWV